MPLIIILSFLTIYGVASAVEKGHAADRSAPAGSSDHIERMAVEMIGKSKSECRKIARQYGHGRWL